MLAKGPAMSASIYRYRPSLGGRLTSITLAVAVCALIVLMLISMGFLEPGPGNAAGKLTAINFRPQAAERAEKKRAAAPARKTVQHQQVVRPQPKPQILPRPQPELPLPFIKMTRQEFAAADIAELGRRRPDAIGETGAGSGPAQARGEGPGGARLYNAEWYRKPSDAELGTYLPRRDVTGGWAMIACKTQERFHVEDCRELGESPPGSGLARALRLASWQFLVRPPRVDGKPMIGVWVRIRIDFTRAKNEAAPDANEG